MGTKPSQSHSQDVGDYVVYIAPAAMEDKLWYFDPCTDYKTKQYAFKKIAERWIEGIQKDGHWEEQYDICIKTHPFPLRIIKISERDQIDFRNVCAFPGQDSDDKHRINIYSKKE